MKGRTIIIKMNGRLGNQLFQYAFARTLQLKYGGDLYVDFSPMSFSKKHLHTGGWDNMLSYYNVVEYKYIDLDNLEESPETNVQRIIWKGLNKIKSFNPKMRYWIERVDYFLLALVGMYYMESYNTGNHICVPRKSNLWIRGWFESPKFFKEYDDVICKELTPKNDVPVKLRPLYKELQNSQSICVHIRRGDFVSKTYSRDFLVCNIDYYKRGIEYIKERYPDSIVFLCSDDIEWAKENLQVVGKVICEPSGFSIVEIHRLMSVCHHFVISNSTFAWWAQHLSSYEHKIVVAPQLWRNMNPEVKDIYENNWVLM